MSREAEGSSAARVISWLRAHIAERELSPGDALPREIDIAAAVGVARSSVREALTGLRALGIIDSRRRGGMRLVREPVLLDLRDWFAPTYDSRSRLDEAMEFRAVVEHGLAELVFARITEAEVAQLRRLVDAVPESCPIAEILEAEKRFHRLLIKGARNRLATLLSALVTPVFGSQPEATPYSAADWRRDHGGLVAGLERRDRASFMRAMRAHLQPYLRLPASSAGRASSAPGAKRRG
jgi:GntR family transcriptional repressor for pyruvate dehydrogenase complex